MPIRIFKIKDNSMQPSLKDGDYVITSVLPYLFSRPKANDMVILKHPKKSFFIVKRIDRETPFGYFVMGDNRAASEDSREFGTIARSSIVGKVISVVSR